MGPLKPSAVPVVLKSIRVHLILTKYISINSITNNATVDYKHPRKWASHRNRGLAWYFVCVKPALTSSWGSDLGGAPHSALYPKLAGYYESGRTVQKPCNCPKELTYSLPVLRNDCQSTTLKGDRSAQPSSQWKTGTIVMAPVSE